MVMVMMRKRRMRRMRWRPTCNKYQRLETLSEAVNCTSREPAIALITMVMMMMVMVVMMVMLMTIRIVTGTMIMVWLLNVDSTDLSMI